MPTSVHELTKEQYAQIVEQELGTDNFQILGMAVISDLDYLDNQVSLVHNYKTNNLLGISYFFRSKQVNSSNWTHGGRTTSKDIVENIEQFLDHVSMKTTFGLIQHLAITTRFKLNNATESVLKTLRPLKYVENNPNTLAVTKMIEKFLIENRKAARYNLRIEDVQPIINYWVELLDAPVKHRLIIEQTLATKNFDILKSANVCHFGFRDCQATLVHNFDTNELQYIQYYSSTDTISVAKWSTKKLTTSKRIQEAISFFEDLVYVKSTIGRINWVISNEISLRMASNGILKTLVPVGVFKKLMNLEDIYDDIENLLQKVRQEGVKITQEEADIHIQRWCQMLGISY